MKPGTAMVAALSKIMKKTRVRWIHVILFLLAAYQLFYNVSQQQYSNNYPSSWLLVGNEEDGHNRNLTNQKDFEFISTILILNNNKNDSGQEEESNVDTLLSFPTNRTHFDWKNNISRSKNQLENEEWFSNKSDAINYYTYSYVYPNRTLEKEKKYCVESKAAKRVYGKVYREKAHYKIDRNEELFYNPSRTDYATLTEELYKHPKLKCYRSSPLRIVHVWSPYVVRSYNNINNINNNNNNSNYNNNNHNNKNKNKNKNIFAPLDQSQSITWESMYRAQQYVQKNINPNHLTVKIYCAILWFDVDILQAIRDPPLCQPENTIILTRSTLTEYPNLTPSYHLPFVQDMIDPILYNNSNNNTNNNNTDDDDDFEYIILTNSDIALVEPFYVLAATTIRKFGFDAFMVNRRTISKGYDNHNNSSVTTRTSADTSSNVATTTTTTTSTTTTLWTPKDIPYLERTEILNYTQHPGSDCFIMRSDVVRSFTLGDLFVGHPPWARTLLGLLCQYMAQACNIFTSEYGWTYHLGDDRSWFGTNNNKNNNTNNNTTNSTTTTTTTTAMMEMEKQKKIDQLFPDTVKRKIMNDCLFRNDNPTPSLHLYQNTQNCAYICQNHWISRKAILEDVERHKQEDNATLKYPLPSYVLDGERFVRMLRLRAERQKAKAKAKAIEEERLKAK